MARDVINRPQEAAMERLLALHRFDAAGTAVRLAWQAGLLRSEIVELDWNMINFLTYEVELADRTIPLSQELGGYLEELANRQERTASRVLLSDRRRRPVQPQRLSLLIREALDEVGQTDVRPIDLRHDFILRQLACHDWQYVSRITGIEAAALNKHFAPYLSTGPVPTRIETEKKPALLNGLRLRKLLQDEGASAVGRAIRLAWQGGLKLQDISNLTWGAVDLTGKILMTAEGPVPLSQELAAFLAPLSGPPEEHVVLSPRARQPMAPERISRVVRTAMIQAGLDNVSLQDLQKDHGLRSGDEDAILRLAEKAGSVTRNQVRDLLGVTANAAYGRLSGLADRGLLTRVGTRYYLPQAVVPPEAQEAAIRTYLEAEGVAYRQDIARLLGLDPRQCTTILNRMVASGLLLREKQQYTLRSA